MFGDHHDHNKPVRYFKLRNSGVAVIHFLIKDSTGGRTVWDGGPTLVAGSDDMIDLSSTPGIDSGNKYRFGAFVKAGKNATDDHAHPVDFKCDLVGVWTWSGTTIVGSKITFEGYERYDKKPPAEMEVARLMGKLECVKCRLEGGTLGDMEMKEVEILAKGAGRGMMSVLVDFDERITIPIRAYIPRYSKL